MQSTKTKINIATTNHQLLSINRLLILGLSLFIFSFFNIKTAYSKDNTLITVNQFVSHVALDAAYNGLNKALNDRNILPDRASLIVGNAQGNISNSAQISKHHASLEPKFMVAIATASAQTNLKAKVDNTILAFVAVTDPEAANLTGHKNVIGVTDNPPIEELIDLALQIFPKLKTVGVIYNSGEVNSVKMTESLKSILDKNDIKLKKVSITNSNDIKNAMNKLIGEVDVIYLPLDNTAVSAIDNIASISRRAKIPLLSNDPTLVDKGVFLALGYNYFESGRQLGNMIADIMDGKKLQENIQNTQAKELKINKELADKFAIDIPEDLQAGDK